MLDCVTKSHSYSLLHLSPIFEGDFLLEIKYYSCIIVLLINCLEILIKWGQYEESFYSNSACYVNTLCL